MNHEQQPQMSGLRIIDNDGAVWPITGSRCLICKMPRDPAVTDPRHPGCRPAQPIPDASLDSLVDHLIQHLGAVAEIASTTTKEERMTDINAPIQRRTP